MKKIVLCFLLLLIVVTGCGKYDKDDAIKDLEKKINDNNYYLEGNLEIVNNDEVYNYEVKSS